jgi:hypothetical protein
MDRVAQVAQVAASLVGVSLLAFAAGVFLARVHAVSGWYYAVGLFLVGLSVLRMLAPTIGISVRGVGSAKRLDRKEGSQAPSPIV